MKTKQLLFCVVMTALLFSACVPVKPVNPTPTQPPLPTPLPIKEPTEPGPTDMAPTAEEAFGPEVVQLGELTMEVYERIWSPPGGDDGSFRTTAGTSKEILNTRRPLRDIKDQPFSPPPLKGQSLKALDKEVEGRMLVTVKIDEEEVFSVNAGDSGPISNRRGLWVIGEDWYLEVAHVDYEANHDSENNRYSTGTGEIFKNGVSLSEQNGYEETFGFQLLGEKPFFFFSKDGEIGINYDGEVSMLGFDYIPHYGCCSAGAFNPKAYLTMVTFFANKGDTDYYVELGLFSAFNLDILDLSGAGLTVEAFELQDGSWPDEEHHQSRPAGSLPGWVMKRHETERKKSIPYQIGSPLFEGKVLSAKTVIENSLATVEVMLDDEVVVSVPVGDLRYAAAMDFLQGLWTHEEHWYMEMIHIDGKVEGNIVSVTTNGEIFRSGESLSELFGYDETFGFQVMAGKPFFFFRKGDEYGLNYADEEVLLGFDEIAHYYCCGFGIYNPSRYENMVSFFASKDGVRYYVEAGVFEEIKIAPVS